MPNNSSGLSGLLNIITGISKAANNAKNTADKVKRAGYDVKRAFNDAKNTVNSVKNAGKDIKKTVGIGSKKPVVQTQPKYQGNTVLGQTQPVQMQPVQAQPVQTQPQNQADTASWVCVCGVTNTSKFCGSCGNPKPAGAPKYKCDKCGWQPTDMANVPKFCPDCGDPFNDGDIVQ